jgi:uncharacterized metal-binding protein YceD (DUF177 family)
MTMAGDTAAEPEFFRPLSVDRLGDGQVEERIEATEAERRALARRLGLLSLDRLSAEMLLTKPAQGVIRAEGRFEADVVQACVVSLEPVASRVAEALCIVFSTAVGPARHEVLVEAEGEDEPEPIVNGVMDLGEAVAQCLAVALDPYPRAAGAQPAALSWPADTEEKVAPGPFAALGLDFPKD